MINKKKYKKWRKKKKSCKSNGLKISAPTWNEKLELPDGWYSVSDVQDYFRDIIKKYKAVTDIQYRLIYMIMI